MSNKTNKDIEKEKITHKESVFLVVAILMSIVGGFIGNNLTIFSKDLLLKYPLWYSISATAVSFLFVTLLFLLIKIYRVEEFQNFSDFLVSVWKSDWKLYLSFTALVCSITFISLYTAMQLVSSP